MKTKFKSVALLLGMSLLPLCANAQKKVIIEDKEPNSIMFVSRDKAGDEIIRIMEETQLKRFHEPKAPRFLLTDQKGKFALGIGGYVRATAEYDFGGIVKDVDFYPALIPNKGNGYVKNQFQMDASTSTLLETGRSYEEFRRFCSLYSRKFPGRRQNIRTSKCICFILRIYIGIQLRFVHGLGSTTRHHRLCRT